MIGDIARSADPGAWPTLGFLIFASLFVLAAIWIYRPSHKRELEHLRRMPFVDDQPLARRTASDQEERS